MFLTSSLCLPKHLIGFPFLDFAYWQVCWNSPSLIHLDFFGLNFKRTYGTLPPKADRIHPACIWVIYDYISCCCEVIHEGPYWWLIDPWLNPWPSCLPFGRSGQYPHSHYKQDIGELEVVHPVVTISFSTLCLDGVKSSTVTRICIHPKKLLTISCTSPGTWYSSIADSVSMLGTHL